MNNMKRFIVIQWPESQHLFEFDDYREHCYLINDGNGIDKYGSSSYFVEEQWYNKNFKN